MNSFFSNFHNISVDKDSSMGLQSALEADRVKGLLFLLQYLTCDIDFKFMVLISISFK